MRPEWPALSAASRAKAEEHGLMRSVAQYVAWYQAVLRDTPSLP